MLTAFINALMSAEADAVCGAPYGLPSADRVNVRNGYRHRDFDTRAGTLDVAIPKLRSGSYFPDWLLERRHRAEAALISVVATCYLLGVSTRRMEKLVETLGITRLSVTVFQFRTITKARYPALRAFEALAATVPLFLLLFASAYFAMARTSPASFSTYSLTRTDALYFTVTTFSTVGMDITAVTVNR
jgi:transposase-like protein